MITNVQDALEEVRTRIQTELGTGQIADITQIVEELDVADETSDDLWNNYLSEREGLISFDCNYGSSPMINTSASAVALMDLGGSSVFVISPGDPGVGFPMLAYSAIERYNRAAAFRSATDWILSSRRAPEPPGACPLPDEVWAVTDFPEQQVREIFIQRFTDPVTAQDDIAQARKIIEACGSAVPNIPLQNPEMADIEKLTSANLEAVLA